MQRKVTTYAELRKWVKAFADGSLDILVIDGAAGVGKSTLAKAVMGESARWIEGRVSPSRLYKRLFDYADAPFVIDDVDDLYRDPVSVNLLKCLCQTESTKHLMWDTNAAWLESESIPREFPTKSKVCILCNRWETLDKHISAVEDRGVLVRFRPSSTEVHDYVVGFGTDWEHYDEMIYWYMVYYLPVIVEPSIRYYRNARKLKQAGLDWSGTLLESFGLTEDRLTVLQIAQSDWQENYSHAKRARIFAKRRGKTKRTYYRVLADLRKAGIAI